MHYLKLDKIGLEPFNFSGPGTCVLGWGVKVTTAM